MFNKNLFFVITLLMSFQSFSFDNNYATEIIYLSKFTDKRIPVVVLDTGINFKDNKVTPFLCVNGHKDYTGEGLFDQNGHGTNVAWQIIKSFNKQKYCILAVKYYSSTSRLFGYSNNLRGEIKGFEYAIQVNSALVNFSGGGEEYSKLEEIVIKNVLKKGIKVAVASGNNGSNLDFKCNFFPACLKMNNKNFHVVGGLTEQKNKMSYSNYGSVVTDWALGVNVKDQNDVPLSGTSQATAIVSGILLKE